MQPQQNMQQTLDIYPAGVMQADWHMKNKLQKEIFWNLYLIAKKTQSTQMEVSYRLNPV